MTEHLDEPIFLSFGTSLLQSCSRLLILPSVTVDKACGAYCEIEIFLTILESLDLLLFFTNSVNSIPVNLVSGSVSRNDSRTLVQFAHERRLFSREEAKILEEVSTPLLSAVAT